MKKDTKAQVCPQCNEKTLYIEKRNAKYSRYRCINKNCNYTKAFQPHISKNKINNLNGILNILNMCTKKKNYGAIEKMDFGREKFLTTDNIDEFKIVHNGEPKAYPTHNSIILLHTNNELRFVSLFDYNKALGKITYLPPGNAYNKKEDKENEAESILENERSQKQSFEEFKKELPDHLK